MTGSLKGVGVAVTRGEGGDGPLTSILKGRGAQVLDWGSIAFSPPDDVCPLLSALARICDYHWICFSSPRAVEAVVSRAPDLPPGVKVAAVGPSTAEALEKAGWPVHRLPTKGSGEGLVEAFREAGDASGARVFFPASAVARDVIPKGLGELGAHVDQRTAYQMVRLPLERETVLRDLSDRRVHVVTFASPSAMAALRESMGEELFVEMAGTVPAAAMGPTTASALEEAGWSRMTVAEEPTLDGLADAAAAAVALVEPTQTQLD